MGTDSGEPDESYPKGTRLFPQYGGARSRTEQAWVVIVSDTKKDKYVVSKEYGGRSQVYSKFQLSKTFYKLRPNR
jgi:hypothetical protein